MSTFQNNNFTPLPFRHDSDLFPQPLVPTAALNPAERLRVENPLNLLDDVLARIDLDQRGKLASDFTKQTQSDVPTNLTNVQFTLGVDTKTDLAGQDLISAIGKIVSNPLGTLTSPIDSFASIYDGVFGTSAGKITSGPLTGRSITELANNIYFTGGYLGENYKFYNIAIGSIIAEGFRTQLASRGVEFQTIDPKVYAKLLDMQGSELPFQLNFRRFLQVLPGLGLENQLKELLDADAPEGWTPELQWELVSKEFKWFERIAGMNGIGKETLSKTHNVDDWYFRFFTQMNVGRAALSLQEDARRIGGTESFLKRTVWETFVVDGFLNDPDMAFDILIATALTLATIGGGAAYVGRKVAVSRLLVAGGLDIAEGANLVTRAVTKFRTVARKIGIAGKLLPVNIGETTARGIFNKAVGKSFFEEATITGLRGFGLGSLGHFASGFGGGLAAEFQNQRVRQNLGLQDSFDWHGILHVGLISGVMAPTGNRIMGIPLNLLMKHASGGAIGLSRLGAERFSGHFSTADSGPVMRDLATFVRLWKLDPNALSIETHKLAMEDGLGIKLETLIDWGVEKGPEKSAGMHILGELMAVDETVRETLVLKMITDLNSKATKLAEGEKLTLEDFYDSIRDAVEEFSGHPGVQKFFALTSDIQTKAQIATGLAAERLYQKHRTTSLTPLSRKDFFAKLSEHPEDLFAAISAKALSVYTQLMTSISGTKGPASESDSIEFGELQDAVHNIELLLQKNNTDLEDIHVSGENYVGEAEAIRSKNVKLSQELADVRDKITALSSPEANPFSNEVMAYAYSIVHFLENAKLNTDASSRIVAAGARLQTYFGAIADTHSQEQLDGIRAAIIRSVTDEKLKAELADAEVVVFRLDDARLGSRVFVLPLIENYTPGTKPKVVQVEKLPSDLLSELDSEITVPAETSGKTKEQRVEILTNLHDQISGLDLSTQEGRSFLFGFITNDSVQALTSETNFVDILEAALTDDTLDLEALSRSLLSEVEKAINAKETTGEVVASRREKARTEALSQESDVITEEVAPATDAPATDAPATDAPVTDAPATDAPVTDAPVEPPAETASEPDFEEVDTSDLDTVVDVDKAVKDYVDLLETEGELIGEDALAQMAESTRLRKANAEALTELTTLFDKHGVSKNLTGIEHRLIALRSKIIIAAEAKANKKSQLVEAQEELAQATDSFTTSQEKVRTQEEVVKVKKIKKSKKLENLLLALQSSRETKVKAQKRVNQIKVDIAEEAKNSKRKKLDFLDKLIRTIAEASKAFDKAITGNEFRQIAQFLASISFKETLSIRIDPEVAQARAEILNAFALKEVEQALDNLNLANGNFINDALKTPLTSESITGLLRSRAVNHYVLSPLLLIMAQKDEAFRSRVAITKSVLDSTKEVYANTPINPQKPEAGNKSFIIVSNVLAIMNIAEGPQTSIEELADWLGRPNMSALANEPPVALSELDSLFKKWKAKQRQAANRFTNADNVYTSLVDKLGPEGIQVLAENPNILNKAEALEASDPTVPEGNTTIYSSHSQRPEIVETVDEVTARKETETTRNSDGYKALRDDIDFNDPVVIKEWITVLSALNRSLRSSPETSGESANPDAITQQELQEMLPLSLTTGQKIRHMIFDGTGGQTTAFTKALLTKVNGPDVRGKTEFSRRRLIQITDSIITDLEERLGPEADEHRLLTKAITQALSQRQDTTTATLDQLVEISGKDDATWRGIGSDLFGGKLKIRIEIGGGTKPELRFLTGLYPLMSLFAATTELSGPMHWSTQQGWEAVATLLANTINITRNNLTSTVTMEQVLEEWGRYTFELTGELGKGLKTDVTGEIAYRGIAIMAAMNHFFSRVQSGNLGRTGLSRAHQTTVLHTLRAHIQAHPESVPEGMTVESILESTNLFNLESKNPPSTFEQGVETLFIAYLKSTEILVDGPVRKDISAFGNGQLGYSPAMQTGKAFMDFLSEKSEGHTRHQVNRPIAESRTASTKANPSEIAGRSLKGVDAVEQSFIASAQHAAGARQALIEKMREDFTIKSRLRFAWSQAHKLKGPEGAKLVERIIAWAASPKHATIFGEDRSFYRVLPSLLDPTGQSPIWNLEDHIENIYDSLTNLPAALLSYVHDSMTGAKDNRLGFVRDGEGPDSQLFTLDPSKFGIPGFGFMFAAVQPFSAAHALVEAGSRIGRSEKMRGLSRIALTGWQALVDDLHSKGIAVDSVLDKHTYFDSTFNGVHHQLAIMADEILDFTDDIIAKHDGVSYSLPQLLEVLGQSWEEGQKAFFVGDKDFDPYKIAFTRIFQIFDNNLSLEEHTDGVTQERVRGVIQLFKDMGLLSNELVFGEADSLENFTRWLKDETSDIEIKENLREFFKNPIMFRIYTGGRKAIKGAISANKTGKNFIQDSRMLDLIDVLSTNKALTQGEAIDELIAAGDFTTMLTLHTEVKNQPLLDAAVGLKFTAAELLHAMSISIKPELLNATKGSDEATYLSSADSSINTRLATKISGALNSGKSPKYLGTFLFLEQLFRLKVAEKAEIIGVKVGSPKFKAMLDKAFKSIKQMETYLKEQYGDHADIAEQQLSTEDVAVLELIANGLDPSGGVDRWNQLAIYQKGLDMMNRVGHSINREGIGALNTATNNAFARQFAKFLPDIPEDQVLFMLWGVASANMRIHAASYPATQTSTLGQVVRFASNEKDSNPFGLWQLTKPNIENIDSVRKLAALDILMRTANMEFTDNEGGRISLYEDLGFADPTSSEFLREWFTDSAEADRVFQRRLNDEAGKTDIIEKVDKAIGPAHPINRYPVAAGLRQLADIYNKDQDAAVVSNVNPEGIFSFLPLHTQHEFFSSLGVPLLRTLGYARERDTARGAVTSEEVNDLIQHNPDSIRYTYDPDALPTFIPADVGTNFNYGRTSDERLRARLPYIRAQRLHARLDSFAKANGLAHLLPASTKTAKAIKDDLLKLYFYKEINRATIDSARKIQSFLTPGTHEYLVSDGELIRANDTNPETIETVMQLLVTDFTARLLKSMEHHMSARFTITDLAEMFPGGVIPKLTEDVLFRVDSSGKQSLRSIREITTRLAHWSNNLFGLNPKGDRTAPLFVPIDLLQISLIDAGVDIVSDGADQIFVGKSGSRAVPVGIHAQDSSMVALSLLFASEFENWRETGVTLGDQSISASDIRLIMKGEKHLTPEEMTAVSDKLTDLYQTKALRFDLATFEKLGLQLAMQESPLPGGGVMRTLRFLPSEDVLSAPEIGAGLQRSSAARETARAAVADKLLNSSMLGTTTRILVTPDRYRLMLSSTKNSEFIERLKLGGLIQALSIGKSVVSDRLSDYQSETGITSTDARQNAHDDAKAMDLLVSTFTGNSSGYEKSSNLNAVPVRDAVTNKPEPFSPLRPTPVLTTENNLGFNQFFADLTTGILKIGERYGVTTMQLTKELSGSTPLERAAGGFLFKVGMADLSPAAALKLMEVFLPGGQKLYGVSGFIEKAIELGKTLDRITSLSRAERTGYWHTNPFASLLSSIMLTTMRGAGGDKAIHDVLGNQIPGEAPIAHLQETLFYRISTVLSDAIKADPQVLLTESEFAPFKKILEEELGHSLNSNNIEALQESLSDIFAIFSPEGHLDPIVPSDPEIIKEFGEVKIAIRKRMLFEIANGLATNLQLLGDPHSPISATLHHTEVTPAHETLVNATTDAGFRNLLETNLNSNSEASHSSVNRIAVPIKNAEVRGLLTPKLAAGLRYILAEQITSNPHIWENSELLLIDSEEALQVEYETNPTFQAQVLAQAKVKGKTPLEVIVEKYRNSGGLFLSHSGMSSIIIKTESTTIHPVSFMHIVLHEISHLFEESVDSITLNRLKSEMSRLYRSGRLPKLFESLISIPDNLVDRDSAPKLSDALLGASNEIEFSSELFASLFPTFMLSRIPTYILSKMELTSTEQEFLAQLSADPETKGTVDNMLDLMSKQIGNEAVNSIYESKLKMMQMSAVFPELGVMLDALYDTAVIGSFREGLHATGSKAISTWKPKGAAADIKDKIDLKADINLELVDPATPESRKADLRLRLKTVDDLLSNSLASNALGVRYADYFPQLEKLKKRFFNDDTNTWDLFAIRQNSADLKTWVSWVFENLNSYIGDDSANPLTSLINSSGLSSESRVGSFLREFMVAPSKSNLTYDSAIGAIVLLSGFIADDFRMTTGILNANGISSLTSVRDEVGNAEAGATGRYNKLLTQIAGTLISKVIPSRVHKARAAGLNEAIRLIMLGESFESVQQIIGTEVFDHLSKFKAEIGEYSKFLQGHLENVQQIAKDAGIMPKKILSDNYPIKLSPLTTSDADKMGRMMELMRDKIRKKALDTAIASTHLTNFSPSIAYAAGLFPNLGRFESFQNTWETFSETYGSMASAIMDLQFKNFGVRHSPSSAKDSIGSWKSLYAASKEFFSNWEHYRIDESLVVDKAFKRDYLEAIQNNELFGGIQQSDVDSRLTDLTDTSSKNLLGRKSLDQKTKDFAATDGIGLLAKRFLSNVGTGSFFSLKTSREFPSTLELLYDIKSEAGTDRLTRSELSEFFENDPGELLAGVSKTIHFDGAATRELKNFTKVDGLTFNELMDILMHAVRKLDFGFKDPKNGGRPHDDSMMMESLDYMKQVYTYTAGRRKSYNGTKDNAVLRAIAPHSREVTVIAMGGNLALATLMVEGTLSALNTLLGPGKLEQPLTALIDFLAPLSPVTRKEIALDMAYGLYYGNNMNVRGLDWSAMEEIRNGRNENMLSKVLGPIAQVALIPSIHINRNIRIAQSSVFRRRFMERWKRGVYDSLAAILPGKEFKSIDEYKSVAREAGFGPNHQVEAFHAQVSGIVKYLPEIKALLTHSGDVFDYKIMMEEIVYPGIIGTAPNSKARAKAMRMREAVDALRNAESRHIQSVVVSSHPLDADLSDHGFAYLIKQWRQYLTSFTSQRIRRDSNLYSPAVLTGRLITHILGDSIYMLLLRIAGGYALEDEKKRLREKPIFNMIQLISRTPMFGFWGSTALGSMLKIYQVLSGEPTRDVFSLNFIGLGALEKIVKPATTMVRILAIDDPQRRELEINKLFLQSAQLVPFAGDAIVRSAAGLAGGLPKTHASSTGGSSSFRNNSFKPGLPSPQGAYDPIYKQPLSNTPALSDLTTLARQMRELGLVQGHDTLPIPDLNPGLESIFDKPSQDSDFAEPLGFSEDGRPPGITELRRQVSASRQQPTPTTASPREKQNSLARLSQQKAERDTKLNKGELGGRFELKNSDVRAGKVDERGNVLKKPISFIDAPPSLR